MIAAGGTLFNVQLLAATEQPPNRPPVVSRKAPVDEWVASARAFGLYAEPTNWSTPAKIAFSERETLLLTALGLALIATLPASTSAD